MDIDIFIIFGSLLVVIGLSLSLILYRITRLNNNINTWKKVQGIIIQSTLDEVEDSYAYDIDEYNTTDSVSYKVNILYEYSINNNTYKSKRIYSSALVKYFLTSYQKKKIVKQFPKDSKIMVYVNPNSNKQSALIKEAPIVTIVILTITFIAIGAFFILSKQYLDKYF